MIQFEYPSSGIGRKERKKYTFSNFRGVDTSVAPINVDSVRAVESTNFVDRNGVLHKRYGWEQMYQFDCEINGFWALNLGGVDYTICYAGTTFYILKETGWEKLYRDEYNTLVSRRTACYVQNNKAYFIGCGDLLVFRPARDTGIFQIYRVADDEDTYIPTTTAQILPTNETDKGLHGQYVRDGVNLLTGWRKNTLVPYAVEEVSELVYQLDGNMTNEKIYPKISLSLKKDNKEKVAESYEFNAFALGEKIELTENSSYEISGEYIINFYGWIYSNELFPFYNIEENEWGNWAFRAVNKNGQSFGLRWKREANGGSYMRASLNAINENDVIVKELCKIHKAGSLSEWKIQLSANTYKISLADLTQGSTLVFKESSFSALHNFMYSFENDEFSAVLSPSGKLTIKKWAYTEKSETPDVTVQFYVDSNNSEKITSCKYSTLYGVDGEADRLFLANGTDANLQNIIYFSEMDDFTYFPDNFTKAVGGNSNGIQGFLRLANGYMAALKTHLSTEPTIFVFKGDYISGYYDAAKTEEYTLPRFATIGASTTQGVVAPHASFNLADDSLFLSQNGVYALELSQGTDSQRFAKERSLPINKLLKECNYEELADACAITYENKYYLAVKHYKPTKDASVLAGKTYYEKKGDSYVKAESPDEDRGMSWYFEQEDCVYVADAHYTYKPAGAMADAPSYEWYPLTNIPAYTWFIIGQSLYFGTKDGRICRFTNDYEDVRKLYFATDLSESQNTIKQYSQSQINAIGANAIDTEKDAADFDFDMDDNGEIDTFSIAEALDVADGDVLIFLAGTVTGTLYGETVDFIGKELLIQRVYDAEGNFKGIQLKYAKDGNILQFKSASNVEAVIQRKAVVKAYREFPTFDFGMPDYLKSIESFTITLNGMESGYALLDIRTRQNEKRYTPKGQSRFNLLEGFNSTSFNVPFQNSYTKRILVRNFNYMSIALSNEIAGDCSIASISFTYKYNRVSGGIK